MGGIERYKPSVQNSRFVTMADGVGDEHLKGERFRALVLPHLDDVYTLARYLLGNATDAEDAAQETCLRAYRYLDGFRGNAMKPWLFAILRNVCRSAHAGGKEVALDDSGGEAAQTPLWREEDATTERSVAQHADTASIRRLIATLPPVFREVIVLREINDLPYREIAEVTGVPIGTVMSRLARARNLLREAWIAAERGEP